jgi:hypothetical protein
MKIVALRRVAAALLFLATGAFLSAKEDLPDAVRQGLVAYAEGTFPIAIDVWLKNAALDDVAAAKQELNAIGAAEHLFGVYEGYEVVREVVLSSRIKRVYLVLNYERGPLWIFFDVYQKKDSTWEINRVKTNKNPEELLPEGYLAHS